jgi:hypothetical protein
MQAGAFQCAVAVAMPARARFHGKPAQSSLSEGPIHAAKTSRSASHFSLRSGIRGALMQRLPWPDRRKSFPEGEAPADISRPGPSEILSKNSDLPCHSRCLRRMMPGTRNEIPAGRWRPRFARPEDPRQLRRVKVGQTQPASKGYLSPIDWCQVSWKTGTSLFVQMPD